MERSPDEIMDELLVLRCQQGDTRAMEQLVARWQPRLWRHAFRLTDREAAASDVVQEAWLAIVRSIRRLDDPARFRQWAYRIVSNKCADWTRRQQRQRRTAQAVAENRESVEKMDRASARRREKVQELKSAFRQLPPDRRAILSMLYLEGMSIQQIAEALAVPLGTVKSRLHAARNELKSVIERTSQ